VRLGDVERDAVSEQEGFFRTLLQPTVPLDAGRLWHPVEMEVVSGATSPTAITHVLTPPADTAFGIISDIDDTVIRTDATNFLRMMRGVLFSNARTRLPFEGVAAFYQALHRGARDDGANPVFYVSSSPWNLYDALIEFLEHRSIPMGPLILRDWGIGRGSLPLGHRSHKEQAIHHILDTYPHMPFLLIGDSGQQDPEIYADVVAAYPRRIMGIYIRDVTGHAARRTVIEELARRVHEAGSVLVLAEDTVSAARHAAERGWMSQDAVEGVRVEAARDHGPGRARPEHDPVVIE
jgi:phosphatidate phosphatase APP1